MNIINEDTFNKFNSILITIIESENFLRTNSILNQFITINDVDIANTMYTMEYTEDLLDISLSDAENYFIYIDLLNDRTPGTIIYANADYENFSKDEFQRLYDKFNTTLFNDFEKTLQTKLNEVLSKNEEVPLDFIDFIFNDFLSISAYLSFSKTKDYFIEEQLKAYINGAMPCGWYGEYPNGKLVVYLPSAKQMLE